MIEVDKTLLQAKAIDGFSGAYQQASPLPEAAKPEIIIVGCSTGGPVALQSLLPRFPQDTDIPIVVIQHMPPGFTRPLAERFDTLCKLHVKEAQNGDLLKPGTIYIAPAGFQTKFNKQASRYVRLQIDNQSPVQTLFKPSVDVALLSAVPIYKERMLVVIMTGMGSDGLLGCKAVKQQNGKIIVEAEESCTVYGMPRVVFEAGLADIQVPLSQIYLQVKRRM